MTKQSDRVAMIDCDDTLILWNIADHPDKEVINIECYGHITPVAKHEHNIKTVIKFAKLGYQLYVWSQSGHEWAKAVVKALELEPYIFHTMSKPMYYFDDLDCKHWMGKRVYRNPFTGAKEDDIK